MNCSVNQTAYLRSY